MARDGVKAQMRDVRDNEEGRRLGPSGGVPKGSGNHQRAINRFCSCYVFRFSSTQFLDLCGLGLSQGWLQGNCNEIRGRSEDAASEEGGLGRHGETK